ncbi:hypothetical protein TWF694_003597 [Orbilia ellipsospora]|uniref:F-box domain-containing protein n=1 Tax=Orbilia ellipsospora TaxID=2528407 RepID=A0AAV9WZQ0_9PEZI
MSTYLSLPVELHTEILSFLSLEDQISISKTCTFINNILLSSKSLARVRYGPLSLPATWTTNSQSDRKTEFHTLLQGPSEHSLAVSKAFVCTLQNGILSDFTLFRVPNSCDTRFLYDLLREDRRVWGSKRPCELRGCVACDGTAAQCMRYRDGKLGLIELANCALLHDPSFRRTPEISANTSEKAQFSSVPCMIDLPSNSTKSEDKFSETKGYLTVSYTHIIYNGIFMIPAEKRELLIKDTWTVQELAKEIMEVAKGAARHAKLGSKNGAVNSNNVLSLSMGAGTWALTLTMCLIK